MATKTTTPELPGEPLTEAEEHQSVLLYGPIGSGKTTDLAHLAHLGPILMINAEGGIKRRPLQKLGVPVERIRVIQANSFGQLEELFWTLRDLLDDEPNALAGVCWDSVTEIVSRLLSIARGEGYDAAKVKADLMQEEVTRTRHFTDRADWGETTGEMKDLLMWYRDLPCHFAVSALPRRDIDDDGSVHYNPAVNPAFLGDLLGKMDIVGWTENELADDGTERFTGLFRAGMSKEVKDRFRVMPRILAEPTLDRIVAYATDQLDVDSDPVQQAYDLAVSTEMASQPERANGNAVARKRRRRTGAATDALDDALASEGAE